MAYGTFEILKKKKLSLLDKDGAHLKYIYALSIAEEDVKKAIELLENSLKLHSGDIAALNALVYYYSQQGKTNIEALYMQKLNNSFRLNMR